MPTYQYVCTDCGEAMEAQQSFTDDSLTTCPACAGRLRKVFAAVGVVFKGSGFYRTDSRSSQGGQDGDKPDAKKTSPGDGSSAGSGSGTKDGGGKAAANGSGSGTDASTGSKRAGGDTRPSSAASGRAATSGAGSAA